MPEIMTTKEIAKYLKLHEITVLKHVSEGNIPAIRIGATRSGARLNASATMVTIAYRPEGFESG